jgi:hypothetical protein
MRFWIETMLFPCKFSGFAVCELVHQENLRFCDFRINHYKFVYLRLRIESKILRIIDL